MSEISKYDAQKKKLDGLCEEHDLTFRLRHDRYPITLTIKPLTGMDQQMDMLADAENKDYISQDASMVIYRKDGELATKITGTFTISEALRNKFKNIYVKISDYWLQYFFRDIMEKDLIAKSKIPVIDEDEAEDDGEEEEEELPDPEETEDDAEESEADDDEPKADPEVDAELGKVIAFPGEASSDEDLITQAKQLVRFENKASMQLLARRLRIGYAKASQVMTALKDAGVVAFNETTGKWEVLPADVPEEG